MGTLKAFRAHLDERAGVLARCEERLCALQEKYETFFAEVSRAREHELEQLRAHLAADRAALPADFVADLDRALGEADRAFDRSLQELEQAQRTAAQQAEAQRAASVEGEADLHRRNLNLDREEEALKAKVAALLASIADFNARIRAMGRGFGFFSNVFSMRSLVRQRRALDAEQRELSNQIEVLRAAWQGASQSFADEEAARARAWVEAQADAAARAAKLEHLRAQRARLVERSALEALLFERQPTLPAASAHDPACGRCGTRNATTQAFCATCAQRLTPDRPDFAGSLAEIAELNRHHAAFAQGMKACQEIIGLVRGLRSGLKNFTKSVEGMLTTEKKHSLPKLDLEVPAHAINYGKYFDTLAEQAAIEQSLHPVAFAARVEHAVGKVLTESQIQSYFETMGQELSRRAKAQW